MMELEVVWNIFFRGVILFFAVASTLMAGYSLQNKFRLRKVRLSWRAGKLNGYPLFATIFLLLVLALVSIILVYGYSERYGILFAYIWIGCMWFISSYLVSKYYITDYGIVKNINDPSQTIPWFQILDYVERDGKNGVEYLFSYSEMDKSINEGYQQLKLFVPHKEYEAVKKIVSFKLENKIEGHAIPDIDLKRIQDD